MKVTLKKKYLLNDFIDALHFKRLLFVSTKKNNCVLYMKVYGFFPFIDAVCWKGKQISWTSIRLRCVIKCTRLMFLTLKKNQNSTKNLYFTVFIFYWLIIIIPSLENFLNFINWIFSYNNYDFQINMILTILNIIF